ncbi:MAG: nuclear transport factor 2 family protein [Myxococcaceae bacterium]
MNARLLVSAALIAALAAACAPRRIPGTDIQDTDDTRALLTVIDRYRTGVESRNAEAVSGLVAPDFRDDGGTPAADDDLDTRNIRDALTQRFARIDDVRLEIDLRSIDVQDDLASAVYYYTLRYSMPGLSDKVQTASELKRMDFRRIDGEWRIVSGI